MADNSGADAASDRELKIERVLNLSLAEDRRELITACSLLPSLEAKVRDNLDNFLKWFTAPEWRTVYSGGLISGPKTKGRSSGMASSIERLLDITAGLSTLEEYAGFDQLISGLANPSQIASTIFEIEVAAWCASRKHHSALTFSPRITNRAGIKYPDFLWHTSLGDLYCECKQLNMWQRSETLRANSLLATAAEIMGDSASWPKDVRMEIVIRNSLRSDAERELRAVVDQYATAVRQGSRPGIYQAGAFSVAVCSRSDLPAGASDSIIVYQVQVGPSPVLLSSHICAHLIITKSIGMARVRALRGFVKEAKEQLPDAGPGGVFIEMSSGVDPAAQKLQEMLGHPAHRAIVWASIWTSGMPVTAVWQNGQPLDGRLIE